MRTLKNKTSKPITLPTRHVIPAKGQLTVDFATYNHRDNQAILSGLESSGRVVMTQGKAKGRKKKAKVQTDEEVGKLGLTRIDICAMGKLKLIEKLNMLRQETTGSLDDLRVRLADVVFSDD